MVGMGHGKRCKVSIGIREGVLCISGAGTSCMNVKTLETVGRLSILIHYSTDFPKKPWCRRQYHKTGHYRGWWDVCRFLLRRHKRQVVFPA